MTLAQINDRLHNAHLRRREAVERLGKAIAALTPAATATRKFADATTTVDERGKKLYAVRDDLATKLEEAVSEIGIVFEALQAVEFPTSVETGTSTDGAGP